MSNLLPSIIQARSFVHFFHFFFPFFSLSSSSASTTSSCSYEYQETSISKQLFRFRSELVSRFPRRRCTTSCIHTQETQRYKTFFTHFAVRLSDERATKGSYARTFVFFYWTAIVHDQIYIHFIWAKTKHSCLKDFNDQAELSSLSSRTVASFSVLK